MWRPEFSNFHLRAVSYDGDWYRSNEHAYQAAKTLDLTERSRIRQADTPGHAKRMGKPKHLGGIVTLNPDWEQIKVQVMLALCRQKFSTYNDLRQLLLDTGDQVIVEANTWHDNVWGDCICPHCADKPGQNLLGNILMLVRDELRAAAAPTPEPVINPPATTRKPMRLVVAGSRTVTDYAYVAARLDAVCAKITAPITVLSGTARGADSLGEQWAAAHGHAVERYPADWEHLGSAAGIVRNQRMIDTATHACFFWDGKSPGTKHAIGHARNRGIPMRVWIVP